MVVVINSHISHFIVAGQQQQGLQIATDIGRTS